MYVKVVIVANDAGFVHGAYVLTSTTGEFAVRSLNNCVVTDDDTVPLVVLPFSVIAAEPEV